MCAEKIQSVFKGQLQRKRHQKAFEKINKIKNKLKNLVKGWKFWNIYNCKKVKELRNIVKSIN
jgi:hypothetical protein